MGEEEISLDHLAICVTSLERSRRFYRDILRMEVSEPISLRDQSAGLRYGHSLLSKSPALVRDWVSRNQPVAYQHMYTSICHCTAAESGITLILVEQTHPEKGYTRSVTGNTLYGFSFHLSPGIDTDDLAWDLHRDDLTFEHGDIRTDGTIYSPDQPSHSLYIRDPDGRMIELIPPATEGKGDFLTGFGHVTLYASDPVKSSRFYQYEFGLSDITPAYVPRDPWKKSITWLGRPGGTPVILLYQVTRPDGTPVETGGYGLDHIALRGTGPEQGGAMEPGCVSDHPGGMNPCRGYRQDPDGYTIEY